MEFKHLLAITAACIGISGHGIAHAVHVSATVNTATFLSYFGDNTLEPQAFDITTQADALISNNCLEIDCNGFFFAGYDKLGNMYAPDNGSSVILDLGESVTIDSTYEIVVADIDGTSLPMKLGAVSISNDNSSFTSAGNIFGTGDGTLSLASLSGSNFRYIKIQQLNNPDGCNENETVCQTLALDSVLVNHASVVPVPAAVWLFGSGLLGLVGVARKRRSR